MAREVESENVGSEGQESFYRFGDAVSDFSDPHVHHLIVTNVVYLATIRCPPNEIIIGIFGGHLVPFAAFREPLHVNRKATRFVRFVSNPATIGREKPGHFIGLCGQ